MNEKTGHFYTFGPFRLDSRECLLVLDGKPVALAPKAFEVLLVLVENAGHLVDKDDLMKRLWTGTFVEEANVAKHVSLLRRILSEATNGREYIENRTQTRLPICGGGSGGRRARGWLPTSSDSRSKPDRQEKFPTIACWKCWAAVVWASCTRRKT